MVMRETDSGVLTHDILPSAHGSVFPSHPLSPRTHGRRLPPPPARYAVTARVCQEAPKDEHSHSHHTSHEGEILETEKNTSFNITSS